MSSSYVALIAKKRAYGPCSYKCEQWRHPFQANIVLRHSLAYQNAHFYVPWIFSTCFVTPGSIIYSILAQG